ncbi:LADA_0G12618g1_1 [Lachancea dasiensis]|uniref:LADA_0G12618g1_1 n=1 Tax=Lachancea dasiensis TaxID=1072105 RepID=A0A1G4JVR5_9SACH|nr:LADA_0G12618g1_1 [Lachancea dasiensis]
MPKENLIFKLDNLEYQYHHLNNSLAGFQPRLKNTAKTYNAKGKKTSKKISKLLESSRIEDVSRELDSLRAEIIQKKAFYLEKKLTSSLEKTLQQQYASLLKKPTEKNEDKLKALTELDNRHSIPAFAKLFSRSKTCKLVIARLAPTKALKENPPKWFAKSEYFQTFQDKSSTYNPGRVWNQVVLPTRGCEKLLSQAMAGQKVKELLAAFDSGMDLFLNVRKAKEIEQPTAAIGASVPAFNESSSDSASESESESEKEDSKFSEGATDNIDEEEIMRQYEGMLVASDEEEGDSDAPALDPSINYNEVTDEEPSESETEYNVPLSDEEGDEEPPNKKHKKDKSKKSDKKGEKNANLPELMTGYYSGDSDEDFSEDEVAARQIATEPKRKNRRGQRARQKIWEKKFGKTANHVQKRMAQEQSERQQRQVEYEQRAAKRAAKAQEREAAQALAQPSKGKEEKPKDMPMHPSWEAKKKAEEKQKAAKFQGKKIVF